METQRYKNWWLLTVNGLISIAFGLLLVLFSAEVLQTIIMYAGIVLLVAGVVLLITTIRQINKDRSAMIMLFQSVASIAIGLVLLIFPSLSIKIFMILFGVWAILVGIIQLAIVINLKDSVSNKNIWLFNALLLMGLGIVLFFDPFAVKYLVQILGVLAVIFGIVLVYFSVVIRSVTKTTDIESGE